MPIRNMGTLLENIVLVESLRHLDAGAESSAPIDYVNSFAMPPLSPWTAHSADACFSQTQMTSLLMSAPPPHSYAGLLRACLQQLPLGVQGPNGALLCALLSHHMQRPLRLWLNDIPAGHYGNALPALAAMNTDVQQILGLAVPPTNPILTCDVPYPDSTSDAVPSGLSQCLAAWANGAAARLGFLDPMRYRATDRKAGETSSEDHCAWLELLRKNFSGPVLSVHFTGHRNHSELKPEVAKIHADAIASGYQHSLVTSHSHYFTVVAVHDPKGEAASLVRANALNSAVRAQWVQWCSTIQHLPPCVLRTEVR